MKQLTIYGENLRQFSMNSATIVILIKIVCAINE